MWINNFIGFRKNSSEWQWYLVLDCLVVEMEWVGQIQGIFLENGEQWDLVRQRPNLVLSPWVHSWTIFSSSLGDLAKECEWKWCVLPGVCPITENKSNQSLSTSFYASCLPSSPVGLLDVYDQSWHCHQLLKGTVLSQFDSWMFTWNLALSHLPNNWNVWTSNTVLLC